MKKLTSENILVFTKSISTLLNSGLQLQNAVEISGSITKNAKLKNLCKNLLRSLNNGKNLGDSLSVFNDSFGKFYISLIRIGELTGSIADVFSKLSIYMEEKKKIKSKLIQSFSYPTIVLFTSFFVVFAMMIFVFPKLEDIFSAFIESADEIKRRIDAIRTGFIILTTIVALIGITFIFIKVMCKKNSVLKLIFDRIILNLPLLGTYWKTLYTADFCFAMKLLIVSGLPLTTSIEKASEVIKNNWYKSTLNSIKFQIEAGEQFSYAFSKEKLFPEYFVTWISLCERTGNVEEAFLQLDEYYRNEMEEIASKISVSAEPVLILMTGGIVLLIATQFVMPVFNLLGGL